MLPERVSRMYVLVVHIRHDCSNVNRVYADFSIVGNNKPMFIENKESFTEICTQKTIEKLEAAVSVGPFSRTFSTEDESYDYEYETTDFQK